jgi:ferredoxin
MGMRTFSIAHKRGGCIGCASCALLAPETWSINIRDGKADVRDGVPKGKDFVVTQADASEYESNRAAAAACPARIIRIS